MDDDDWVRGEVRRAFGANVRANIGAWSDEALPAEPELGRPLYEYRGARSSIVLYERGLIELGPSGTNRHAYEDLEEVVLLRVAELAHIRDPDEPVAIRLKLRGGGLASFEVPAQVYSPMGPALFRIAARFALAR